ncbi:MAG: hypothetical protein ACRDA3_00180 [Peptostreptococcaceae bacterium]
MTKDKKYIENLFRNFKKNKARLKILELGLVSDEDNVIGAIDYSKDRIQTSNLSSLDNIVERRENEKEQLEKDIAITEILLDSMDSRKDSQYKKIIENYYIENMTQREVMQIINTYDNRHFFNICNKALNSLLEIVEG